MYRTEHLPPETEVLKHDLQWVTFFNYYAQTNNDVTETWTDAVTRATDNLRALSDNKFSDETYQEIFDAIYKQEVLPSMRLFSMPSAAIDRCNTVIYNCAFLPIDTFTSISEIMYLTMSGVGVGYSVENSVISLLPKIPQFVDLNTILDNQVKNFIVPDTQVGWAESVKFLFDTVLDGKYPVFDYSLVRPQGAKLNTKGGYACLTGDTIVYKDRKKGRGFNEITVKELYEKSLSVHRKKYFNRIKLRSLDESTGSFYRNNIIDVYDNGFAPVYELLTENGYRIKATDNHRFMNELGEYEYLANFTVGDLIAVNGSVERKTGTCIDCGCDISRRALRCKSCYNIAQISDTALYTTARQRKQCIDYIKDECELCGKHVSESNKRFERHHIDKNPHNNDHDNLLYLCPKCHQSLHAKDLTFGDPYSHKYMSYDKIISIKYVGVEQVYDLQMAAPNHNFIANGFVSHNSGPEPLQHYHEHALSILVEAQGRQLTSIELHDIINMISECAVSNGSRSGAMICVFDDSDKLMLNAKSDPKWYIKTPWRAYSNNSVRVNGTTHEFIDDIVQRLIYDEVGEPGLSSLNDFAKSGRKAKDCVGPNPCHEITLNTTFGETGGGQFCNLSTVVLKDYSFDKAFIYQQLKIATLIGTIQAGATNFRYLREGWKNNCEDEALLGVCITGIFDHKQHFHKILLQGYKHVIETYNIKFARQLGINKSASYTSVKPSGNTSVLTNTSPGVNPDFGRYQIRNLRVGKHSKMAEFLKAQGVPYFDDPFETNSAKHIFSFKRQCDATYTLENSTVKDQIENYLLWSNNYVTHNVSVTITYKEEEKEWLANWIKENYDKVGGMAFLPQMTDKFPYMPIDVVDEETYNNAPEFIINWSEYNTFVGGNATPEKVLECSGDRCDIAFT